MSTATLSAFRPSYGLPTYSNGVVNLPNHNVTVDYNAVASTNLIDLTNITEIKVTYNIKSMGNYKPVVGIGDSNTLPVENMSSRWGPIINVGYSFVNTSQRNQRVTFSWDVTSYTGSHYICVAVDEHTEMDVYDIAYK